MFKNRTFLIVEPNKGQVAILRSILREGHAGRILEAQDAGTALEITSVNAVDVAFISTDLVLTTGFEFARLVRHDKDVVNPMLAMILMAHAPDRTLLKQAILNGIDAIVPKPMSAADVLGRVKLVLERPVPYIRTPAGYFGPDRRRRADPAYRGADRRRANRFETVVRDASGHPTVIGASSATALVELSHLARANTQVAPSRGTRV